jgi:acyl-CoA synthetase (AMP-forming)/AMP-acid ligase II
MYGSLREYITCLLQGRSNVFGTTISVLRKQADRSPHKDFVVGPERRLSYLAFYKKVNQLANWLAEKGVTKGDNVGLLMYNCPELYIGILAVHRVGAIANLWNFRLSATDLVRLREHVNAKAVIVSPEFLANLAAPSGVIVLCPAQADAVPSGIHSFCAVEGMPEAEPLLPDPDELDVSSVIYTSGTTGHPKGAAYTHQKQLLSAIQYCLEMGLNRGSRGITAAPVIHGGATNFFFAYLFIGGSFIDSGKYNAERILQLTAEYKATELMAVPTQIMEMLNAVEQRRMPENDFSSLQLIRTAGSPYPKSMVERVHKAFRCHLLNTFGMTENCSNVTSMHSGHDPEEAWTTIGKPTYFWETRVVEINPTDSTADRIVAAPGRGQLIVKGPQNAQHYYLSDKKPAYHAGWLFARDVVDVNEAGYMQIVDRVDETILSGGENIYPQEVEMFLRKHPGIEDAAVIGLPDRTWGEIVVALVIPKSSELDEQQIEQFCLQSGELARYKRPRKIIFVQELPKNVFGKTERSKLREKYCTATLE